MAVFLAFSQPGARASPDATYTVNSTADPGDGTCDATECTLREAIAAANANTGTTDTIAFDIPGVGPHTIHLSKTALPTSGLPDITDPVIIDGTTEPDFAGSPIIELDGTDVDMHEQGLMIAAGPSTIKGLVINRFKADYGYGIWLEGGGGNVIVGNYIGTDVTGTIDLGNSYHGVLIYHGAQDNTIGGETEGERNVISGNEGNGVAIKDSGTNGNTVKGNYIGTDVTGTIDLGNRNGVNIDQAAKNNTIGGTADGQGNVIAYNPWGGVGVLLSGTTGNTISGNSIHSNGGKGIELVSGGNMELAAPIIDSVGGSVSGYTDPKCYPCTVEVFSDNQDEGRIYHGSTTTNDDATGTWSYLGAVTGPNITATITDADGNTSEFSVEFPLPECGDVDTDGDTIRDLCDNCPTTPNPTQLDSDSQDGGDACDVCTNDVGDDTDADGICAGSGYLPPKTGDDDNCPNTPNPSQENNVHPATPEGDHCEDPDADLVFDSTDNCPDAYNPDQTNTDVVVNPPGDQLGDACDPDDDNDGVLDGDDVWCPLAPEDYDAYEDGDGCPDSDNDLDGICDPGQSSPGYCSGSDACPNVAEDYDAYRDTDGCPDPDNDGDFFPDFTDQCPGTDASSGDDGISCTNDPNEVNTCEDYDGVIDTDGCHDSPGDDFDADSLGRVNQQGFPVFWDGVEVYLGTDPLDACPDSSSDDAWPLDINKDGVITVADVLSFHGRINTAPGSPNWWQRLDFNGDGVITVADVLMYQGTIGQTCT